MKITLKMERDGLISDEFVMFVPDILHEYLHKFGMELWNIRERKDDREDRVMSSQLGFRIEKKRKKLYRCHACGDTITEEDYLEALDWGGMGYCYCEYGMDEDGNYNRTLNEYEVFVQEE